jgi:hypothetical protein
VWVQDTLQGTFAPDVKLTPPAGQNLDLCVYFKPDNGAQIQSCTIGTLSTVNGYPACCSSKSGSQQEQVQFNVGPGNDIFNGYTNSGTIVIRVKAADSSTSCSPYVLDFDF